LEGRTQNGKASPSQLPTFESPSKSSVEVAVGPDQPSACDFDVVLIAATVASLTSELRGHPAEFIARAVADTHGLVSADNQATIHAMVAAAMAMEHTAV
jgi:hypothetical protein